MNPIYSVLILLPICLCAALPQGQPGQFGQQQPQPGQQGQGQFGQQGGQAAPSNTEKCDKEQFEKFVAEQILCITKAEYKLEDINFDNIGLDEIKRDICASITSKVQCVTDLGPTCFNSTQNDVMHSQFLYGQFQQYSKANITKPFEPFVASCPILRDNEAKVNQNHFGASLCSFVQYQEFQHRGQPAGEKAC